MSIRKRNSKKAKNGVVYEVYFNYKDNGITRRYSKSGFPTKKKALEHESMVKAQINDDGYLKRECNLTLNEVYEEFMKVGSSKYRPNTIMSTRSAYNKYIRNKLGGFLIAKIRYRELQGLFNDNASLSMRVNKSVKESLCRIFDYAIKNGYVKDNPVRLVDVKGTDSKKKSKKTITFNEFTDIVSELRARDSFTYESYAIAVEIGYYSGLRISEIFALDKDDIDFGNELISVNKQLVYKGLRKSEFYTTRILKTESSNSVIPLAEPLRYELSRWFEKNPYKKIVCDEDGCYLNPGNCTTHIKKALKNLNIDFHFHMLRHTFITNLVNNGTDVKTVQELARHGNFSTTMDVYTHIQESKKRNAINDTFSLKCVENVSNPKSITN